MGAGEAGVLPGAGVSPTGPVPGDALVGLGVGAPGLAVPGLDEGVLVAAGVVETGADVRGVAAGVPLSVAGLP